MLFDAGESGGINFLLKQKSEILPAAALSGTMRRIMISLVALQTLLHLMPCVQYSVPARLGKGQGAKEIGHNLAHEQPKFGHNLVRKRHKIGHTFMRERQKFGLVGDWWKHGHKSACILQAFFHRLSENTKTAITFCKNKTKLIFYFLFFFIFFNLNSGRARVNRAGRKPVRAGRSALRNRPSWNTDPTVTCFCPSVLCTFDSTWSMSTANKPLLPRLACHCGNLYVACRYAWKSVATY